MGDTIDPATNRMYIHGGYLSYDNVGNLTGVPNPTGGPATTFQYTAEGYLRCLNNCTSGGSYLVDGLGQRTYASRATSATSYVYLNGQPMAEWSDLGVWTDYIYANGQKAARLQSQKPVLNLHGTRDNTVTLPDGVEGSVNGVAGGVAGYTIHAGDRMMMTVKQTLPTYGGLALIFNNTPGCPVPGGGSGSLQDITSGTPFYSNGVADGAWHAMVGDLTPFTGCTINFVLAGIHNSAPTGTFDLYIADAVIQTAEGPVLPILTGQGASVTNFSGRQGGAYNLSSGTVLTPVSSPADTNFYLADHLGTTQMELSGGGWPLWQGQFTPFGQEIINGGTLNAAGAQPADGTSMHYKFTGKERDQESGLDYFGARMYSSVIGRFSSPDPLGLASGSLANPQSLNLYSYVMNNPLTFTDPDGRECVWDDGSYDSNDDKDTGSADKCSSQGGTWIGHDVFANSSYYRGDWSGDANSSLSGLVGNIQSCTAAVGGGQGASLLIANAFASGFSNDQTAYTLASAAWESGPGGIGANMTEVGSPSYFNKYNAILGNKSNSDAFAYRGRGYVQLTGKSNYQKWSNELGTNLVANPNLAATPDVAAQIVVEGLDRGSFTGVSLGNYVNTGGTDFVNARRAINGTDNAQAIASSANSFSRSLSGCR